MFHFITRIQQICGQIKNSQGVQGLQAFAFCVVTVNDGHTKPKFKIKCRIVFEALV